MGKSVDKGKDDEQQKHLKQKKRVADIKGLALQHSC